MRVIFNITYPIYSYKREEPIILDGVEKVASSGGKLALYLQGGNVYVFDHVTDLIIAG